MTRRRSSAETDPGSDGGEGPGAADPTGTREAEVSLERVRRVASEALLEHFAAERLTMEEFERRMDRVKHASSPAALRALLAGLPGRVRETEPPTGEEVSTVGSAVPGPVATAGLEEVERRGFVVWRGRTVGGGGPWIPPRTLWIVATVGRTRVDFREARLPPGITEVRILGAVGPVEILVPRDVPVDGGAAAGARHGQDETTAEPGGPGGGEPPRLRVRAFPALGRVTIRTVGGGVRSEREEDGG